MGTGSVKSLTDLVVKCLAMLVIKVSELEMMSRLLEPMTVTDNGFW